MTRDGTDVDSAMRAARVEMRERQVIDAAIGLMQQKGSGSVSMQAIAKAAGVSVGLLYQYFGDKEQILLAVMTRVLTAFRTRVPTGIADVEDPILRVIGAFGEFCRAVDENRHAIVLTYRDSRILSREVLGEVMRQEIETLAPLVDAVTGAAEAGDLRDIEPELFAYDLLLLAHAWALKNWYFARQGIDVEGYIQRQTRTIIAGALTEAARARVSV